MKKLRVIFFGTPGLSANILAYLGTQSDVLDIIAVVTNTNQPAGRGHELTMSPVGKYAKDHNIILLQPEKVKNNPDFLNTIHDIKPDICIVVAYGKILPQELLDIPPMGFLNVHTSLLPKYRGAAPIQHALLQGEKVTGLTVMQMSLGMDAGDILVEESWDISASDTTGKFFEKTSLRAGPLLIKALTGLQDGTITPQPQNAEEATYTQMIEKKDGELQTSWTMDEAYHRWQAYTPWPGLYVEWNGIKVTLLEIEKSSYNAPLIKGRDEGISSQVTKVESLSGGEMKGDSIESHKNSFGKIPPTPLSQGGNKELFIVDKLPAVQLADGILIIKKIHPSGKKPMSGEEFVRGFMKN